MKLRTSKPAPTRSGNEMASSATVSYTHLDVYKRQGFTGEWSGRRSARRFRRRGKDQREDRIEQLRQLDPEAPRKQRHTAHRIWTRLKAEHPEHPVGDMSRNGSGNWG